MVSCVDFGAFGRAGQSWGTYLDMLLQMRLSLRAMGNVSRGLGTWTPGNRVQICRMLQALLRFAVYWTRRHCRGRLSSTDETEGLPPCSIKERSFPGCCALSLREEMQERGHANVLQ